MKNLLIYINPNKQFDDEHKILAKIQIDNSFNIGWKKEDIVLVTNFDYEYRGVKSLIVPSELYYEPDPVSTKASVVPYLLKKGIIGNELYWCHDFDVYQDDIIKEIDLDLGSADLGLVSYGYKPVWNFGSFFFKKEARDVLNLLNKKMLERKRPRADEKMLTKLTILYNIVNKDRYKELNVTYNFTMRCIQSNYLRAIKPLKVLHFHPWYKDELLSNNCLNIFMYGKNRLKQPLMSKRLINIFNNNNVK